MPKKKNLILILILFLVVLFTFVGVGMYFSHEEKLPTQKEAPQTPPRKGLNEWLTNEISDVEALHGLDEKLKNYLTRWEINGAQLAISRNDTLIYAKGYGMANKEENETMTPRHIMRMASVSKLITAAGIMKLRDMGLLELTDKVFGEEGILNDTAFTHIIRDKRYESITVEHLLRHQAGFGNRHGDPMFSTRFIMMGNHLDEAPDNRKLLEILLRRRLEYTPGLGQRYSNVGYMILSQIIEKLSGMPYEDFIKKHVLEPAGCFDFHIGGNYYEDRRENEVKYYMHIDATPVPEFNNSGREVEKCYGENDIPRLAGAGAWCASAAELCQFVGAIDLNDGAPDILSKESLHLMTDEQPHYGYSCGWNFTPKGKPWTRTGTLSGTTALVVLYPDGQCWVMLTNTSTWKGQGFAKNTQELFRQLRQKFADELQSAPALREPNEKDKNN